MSDSRWNATGRVRTADGREYAALPLDLYGARSVFVAWRDGDGWSRPRFVPIATGLNRVALTLSAPGELVATFTPYATDRASNVPSPQRLVVAEITKDADGDGWTDLEEAQLGLDPAEKDSDGDGIADDRDSTPLFDARTGQPSEEDRILQRAIFANFGMTGASHALFADVKARRLQLYGIPGPIIYTDSDQPLRERGGGVHVSWRLLERGEDSATVEIVDYEGPLAASGEHVTLRRIAGAWYAVSRRMLWIS
jgi:hypothetical protein